jgi:hypothetical protein
MPEYVWVLNPDCERELSAQHSYAVRAAFKSRISERRQLFEGLVRGEPSFFTHDLASSPRTWTRDAPDESRSTFALLWCPTPHAVSLLSETGLLVPAHPAVDVLRRVHDKRFLSTDCAALTLPGRCIIENLEQWNDFRERMTVRTRTKRCFGYAGKGQRVWTPGGNDDPTWRADSLRQGGFVAEPNVDAAQELSLHGFVDGRGCVLGNICSLSTDRVGAPLAVSPLDKDVLVERYGGGEPLRHLAEQVADRLLAAGYWGPFGLDVLWVDGQPRLIDLNPRFTLGWSIGMGDLREAVIERALAPVALTTGAVDRGALQST